MRKRFLIASVAVVTAGCSPALYGFPHRAMVPTYYPHPRAHAPLPEPVGRWDNVMRLPRGSTVDVLTQDGAANVGPVAGSDVQSVRVLIDGVEVRIARADIVRVDLVDLPGSEIGAVARKSARGALVGAGLMALVTGVIGGEAWPPPGRALRAGIALGGVTGGQTEMMRRAGRLVYLAPDQGARPVIR